MAHDPRQLRPTELCRLLNSTPLGEVIKQRQMQEHRVQAGLRIGTHKHVDLLRYVAWLVLQRHKVTPATMKGAEPIDLGEVAVGAASLIVEHGPDQAISTRQALLIAALLSEPSQAAAAAKLGISTATISRWMRDPAFQHAYRSARRSIVDTALGRVQTATSQAVDTLLMISRHGRRESDRLRAATALMDYALRGHSPEVLPGNEPETPVSTTEIVTILGQRLRELDRAELTMPDRTRLTASLADALLKAISVGVLDKRLEALQTVLLRRKKDQS